MHTVPLRMPRSIIDTYTSNIPLTQRTKFWTDYVGSLKGKIQFGQYLTTNKLIIQFGTLILMMVTGEPCFYQLIDRVMYICILYIYLAIFAMCRLI